MIATIIRAISSYKNSPLCVQEGKVIHGPFGKLKVALITDGMTTLSFAEQCSIRQLSPNNYKDILKNWRPDFVFIESAFYGVQNSWLYHIAKQPAYIRQIKSHALENVLNFAKDLNIPTIFWNKDDVPYFDAFLHVAKLVDYVLTADINFVPLYKEAVRDESKVHVLAMAYESNFHSFTGFDFKEYAPCFLGSYYVKMLDQRKIFFDKMFKACANAQVTLHVYNRHKKHLFHATHFNFPRRDFVQVHDPVPYMQTQDLYKHYGISINVNSVTNSETMLSRRFLEVLACGGILLSNNSPVVQKYFSKYCHCVQTEEEITELLARLKFGPSHEDKCRAEAGSQYVLQNHTWRCRLEQLVNMLNI